MLTCGNEYGKNCMSCISSTCHSIFHFIWNSFTGVARWKVAGGEGSAGNLQSVDERTSNCRERLCCFRAPAVRSQSYPQGLLEQLLQLLHSLFMVFLSIRSNMSSGQNYLSLHPQRTVSPSVQHHLQYWADANLDSHSQQDPWSDSMWATNSSYEPRWWTKEIR